MNAHVARQHRPRCGQLETLRRLLHAAPARRLSGQHRGSSEPSQHWLAAAAAATREVRNLLQVGKTAAETERPSPEPHPPSPIDGNLSEDRKGLQQRAYSLAAKLQAVLAQECQPVLSVSRCTQWSVLSQGQCTQCTVVSAVSVLSQCLLTQCSVLLSAQPELCISSLH